MIAEWKNEGPEWTLELVLHPEDTIQGRGQGTMNVGLLSNKIQIRLPRVTSRPHNDVLALAALVISRPWTSRQLIMKSGGLSPGVALTIHRMFGIDAGPVIDGQEPRRAGKQSILSFSGGADSVAAAELMGRDIPHIHYRRIDHPRIPNRATHVRTDAIEAVVQESARRGRQIDIVRSNLEYICHPYATLPHWFAIAVGCLFLADEYDAGSIALGGTFETYFMDMGRKWTGIPGAGIGELTGLMGLPLLRPVAGATEIGTMRLSQQSNLGDIARSCVLGSFESPCFQCAKCVRKELTLGALNGSGEIPVSIRSISEDTPGMKQLAGLPPFYMQAQLEYCLSRLSVDGTPFENLFDRLGRPEPEATAWMDHFYEQAGDVALDQSVSGIVVANASEKLGLMSKGDIDQVMAWSR